MIELSQIQQDIAAARRNGMSRRSLALASKLTEGKIWRIENKGTVHDDERRLLQPVLDQVLGRLLLGPVADPGATQPDVGQPAADTTAAGADPATPPADPDRPATPPTPAPVASPEPPRLATVGIDWAALREASADATPTESVRAPGPDRSLGFRLVSNSELQTFKDCRRRWWLAYYRQLSPRIESPVGPRAVGTRLHRALKEWYVPAGQVPLDPQQALERLIISDWTLVVQSRGGEEFVDVALRKKFTEEANLERIMLQGYVEYLSETGVDSELEIIGSEAYVEADLTKETQVTGNEKPVKLIGRLDVRARRKIDGVRLFIDHKSVGNFTEPASLLPLDEQMLTYHLLEWLNTDDAEERCDGALYNMLRKVKRTPQAKPPFYQRIEVHHNPIEIERFKRRIVSEIGDMRDVEDALDLGTDPLDVAYPRPSRDCRWKCDFFAVCPMFDDGSRAEAMIDQYFTHKDPLSYYASDEGGLI